MGNQRKPRLRGQGKNTYDIKLSFASVDQAGNEGVAIRGFVPPSEETIPAHPFNPPAVAPIAVDTTSELLFNYQVVGGVPYEYDIGQFEITAAQYCAFLNAVDPEGENPKQPWTKIKLWNEKNNPLVNHFQGQILYVDHADDGFHYAVADPVWADKPVMMINGFQYAYFINSLVNGGMVGRKKSKQKSPLGFDVKLTDRYYRFSETIETGSYDLNDSNYAILERQNIDGLFFPSQDEWIKAAYYAGVDTGNGTNYFYFPTATNEAPIPLFTQEGKNQGLAKGKAAESPFAQVNVSDKGEVQVDELKSIVKKNQGYSNYNFGVFWQPWYAPEGKTYGHANVTNVGGSDSPSPWLAYDMGGNVVEYTDTIAGALDVPHLSEDLQKLPVGYRAHGGIANATGYQLWITATGAGDPYGQILGSAYEYGGTRLSFLGDDPSKKSAKNLRLSSRADVITGQNVVVRVDSTSTFDTHYSRNLGETIAKLADEDAGYISMPSAFFHVPKKDGGQGYYSMTHDATGTSRIVRGKRRMMDIINAGGYSNPVEAFRALRPMEGNVQFIGYFNPTTGAYGYSELETDAVGFAALGYISQGPVWSV